MIALGKFKANPGMFSCHRIAQSSVDHTPRKSQEKCGQCLEVRFSCRGWQRWEICSTCL